ncbi:MAG: DUF5675 family protein [Sediminicola sp.]|tara:strand:- start:9201 stop:9608 length:408 start_codon:yes stop_codon:yes gene_type:complete
MELFLHRTYLPKGTNGSLLYNGEWICHTIELPWAHNKTSVSCIPEGRYLLKERNSERFGRHLILCKVAQRNLILIHAANNAKKELRGCIAPVVRLTGQGTGLRSVPALKRLEHLVFSALDKGEPVYINIIEQTTS